MQYRFIHVRIILCLLLALMLSACGGGSSSSQGNKNASIIPGDNVASLIVDTGPTSQHTVNEVFTSVKICDSPTADNCATIDHVLVDTGSSGLRIMASAIPSSLNLTPVRDTTTSDSILECGMFADGFTWGPVKKATIQLANHTALSVPIQVIGDPNYPTANAPSACTGTGTSENSVSSFGANGVLGVGYFRQDCGTTCEFVVPNPALYYKCATSSNCTGTTLALADQVTNPVTLFGYDNNGVMISLPSLPTDGDINVTGSLVFGVNSESNNQLDTASIYQVDGYTGNFNTIYNGQQLTSSFIDSGSNGLFFNDSTIRPCTSAVGFYCPPSPLSLSATIQGVKGSQTNIYFNVANAEKLFTSGNTAFSDLAGDGFSNTFDWGLPFFYGRKVFVVFEGENVGGSTGPFIAF